MIKRQGDLPFSFKDMDSKLEKYITLSKIFERHSFKLYLVGGTVRDYLLNLDLTDMDLVTDATPSEMKLFLIDADYTFEKMGSIKYKFENQSFDITTLRKEEGYTDFRHPSKVVFVKDLKDDFPRRDFTINGLYMDSNLKVIDYVNGQKDLENHILNTIGEPQKRIKEDPLRILRAIRFSLSYNLTISNPLDIAIKSNIALLNNLNKAKIQQELRKIKNTDMILLEKVFDNFSIKDLLKVID